MIYVPVLGPAERDVAKLLLRESTNLPKYPSTAERKAFRLRWSPWLRAVTTGPLEVVAIPAA